MGGIVAISIFLGLLLTIQRLETPLQQRNVYGQSAYAATIGVTPAVASKDESDLLSNNAELKAAVDKLPRERVEAAIVAKLGDGDGAKFYDAWLLSKGEAGVGHYGLGHKLVGEYVLPFEVVSILLLGALIGAVVIVRKELK
jgi:hypothetical protein